MSLDDLPRSEVRIPEWGGSIYVRALNGEERDQLERMIAADSVSRAAIAALVVVDAEGNRLFTEPSDVAALAKKHGSALERIVTAALRFNAISEDGLADAGND